MGNAMSTKPPKSAYQEALELEAKMEAVHRNLSQSQGAPMNFEIWFKGKPVLTKEQPWTDSTGRERIERTIECEASADISPAECTCRHRYGHREHAPDCPAKEQP